MCASLPPLRPLIARIAPNLIPNSRTVDTGYGYGKNLSRRGDRNQGNHIPLSGSSGTGNKRYMPNISNVSGMDANISEEEIVGLKDMAANPSMGVQPPTVEAPRHMFDYESHSARMSEKAARTMGMTNKVRLQKPLPTYPGTMATATGPGTMWEDDQRPRTNSSLGMWQRKAPEGNEIQVVTRMQQSVEVHDSPVPSSDESAVHSPHWSRHTSEDIGFAK